MNYLFWALFVIATPIVAVIAFIVYRVVKVRGQNRRLDVERFERVAPLYDALESGVGINEEDVRPFAEDLVTRWTTIELLRDRNLLELLPAEASTIEWAAEGNLAQWLEFPTELNKVPDEMEHVERVTIDFDNEGNKVHYHVFKYRTDEPHWAAANGWMLGIAGPYFDDSKPFDWPTATFSRCSSKLGEVTPEEEARWVHENIASRAV